MTKSIREEYIEDFGEEFILFLEESGLYDTWADSDVMIGMYNIWKMLK